jgi:hypothetical protein
MILQKKLNPAYILFENGKKVIQTISEETMRKQAAVLAKDGRHFTCDLYDISFSPAPPTYSKATFVRHVFDV